MDIIFTLKKTSRTNFHVKQRNVEKKSIIFLILSETTGSYADSSKTCLTYLYANVKHPTKVSLLIFFYRFGDLLESRFFASDRKLT